MPEVTRQRVSIRLDTWRNRLSFRDTIVECYSFPHRQLIAHFLLSIGGQRITIGRNASTLCRQILSVEGAVPVTARSFSNSDINAGVLDAAVGTQDRICGLQHSCSSWMKRHFGTRQNSPGSEKRRAHSRVNLRWQVVAIPVADGYIPPVNSNYLTR